MAWVTRMHRDSTLCYVRVCGITNCQQGIPKVRLPLMPRARVRERGAISQSTVWLEVHPSRLFRPLSMLYSTLSAACSLASNNSRPITCVAYYVHYIVHNKLYVVNERLWAELNVMISHSVIGLWHGHVVALKISLNYNFLGQEKFNVFIFRVFTINSGHKAWEVGS